jgi:hypothetical protein
MSGLKPNNMKLPINKSKIVGPLPSLSSIVGLRKNLSCFIIILTIINFFIVGQMKSQGTWTAIADTAPNINEGVMLLLSDGTVIAKTASGGSDGYGNTWNKLTPDIHGSYVNGTWSTIAPMTDTRLYFSTQVLRDGRVYVAGGEYGTGGAYGEVYDPFSDTWTSASFLPNGDTIYDGNSQMLPDGRVLQAVVISNNHLGTTDLIFDPLSNSYSNGPNSLGGHDESAWLILPDKSILFVNIGSTHSERYIPSLNHWVADGVVPDSLYDNYGYETGASFMLPDGRAFFLGSTGKTAYYAPSGDNTPGIWSVGPDIPNGLGTPDAAAAMMVNGKILCAVAPIPVYDSIFGDGVFHSPTSFYEFDYLSNSFTQVAAPGGGDTLSHPSYYTNMLALPDGNILYADQYSNQYYVYTPVGAPVASGKPTINGIIQNGCNSNVLTGTLFNGISVGAAYGDDWQMATNYPIVRLTSGNNVYYARTFNWNRTGVQTGNLPDTTEFTLPQGLPATTYSLVVIANGISSDPITFIPCVTGVSQISDENNKVFVNVNLFTEQATVVFKVKEAGLYDVKMIDVFGRTIKENAGTAIVGENSNLMYLDGIAKGVYLFVFRKGEDVITTKAVVN